MKCVIYTYIIILIGYSGCSDKPSNIYGSNGNDSDEDDNFDVTEFDEEFGQDMVYYPSINQTNYGAIGDPIPIHTTDLYQDTHKIDYGPIGGPVMVSTIQTPSLPPTEIEKSKEQSSQNLFGCYPTDDFQFPPQTQDISTEPPGSGSGDQPPYKTEEGAGGGDYEDEDEVFGSQSLNYGVSCQDEYSTYLPMTFYRLDHMGNYIIMNTTDYSISGFDKCSVKYSFLRPLELIVCNNMTVWIHEADSQYPKNVIYKRFKKTFIFIFDVEIIRYTMTSNQWVPKFFYIPKFFKLYDTDDNGIFCVISRDKYTVQLTEYGGFHYILNHGVKCRMVTIGETSLLTKTGQYNYVKSLTCFSKNFIRMYFPTLIVNYKLINNQWIKYIMKKDN
ncbi:Theileria-specific sub-telomeric protein, SVSP family, putative [Theileria annulata]|uniref:Theileria-specific sub-telomeric protein, SVSP family, putative n=1 Tax=Theileria annulata TaxID=5874 RepID=Q4UAR8_THEAN|nr:Theileria-specific sub-telomeric protein, SVSP family, putative [Theileria annulata]CAI76083.1 Theileria-specific sub-telomeric protein, SVSP family, putative [Theileria annulata]|eukprot:XP_952709.1 Theileria-specific sub-telomeric protein, SVSP family, putative [Theileria annulata]